MSTFSKPKSRSILRPAVSCLLAVVFPVEYAGWGIPIGDVVYQRFGVGERQHGAKTVAMFSGDMLQTRPDSTASIQSNGSSVMVMADSLVKFEGPAVEIEHGGVRVTTSRGMAARAGDVTIKPAGASWTEFQVVRRRWPGTDCGQQRRRYRARRTGNDDGGAGPTSDAGRHERQRETKEKAPARCGYSHGREGRNHEFAVGGLWRHGCNWRSRDLGMAAERASGQPGLPNESLPMSSCQ